MEYKYNNSIIYNNDNLEVLKTLEENSIDAIVTDPPYGLKFMNKHWDYDVPTVSFWNEVYRVLKPGGHILSCGGTRTYHRMTCNIEDAGFEIRDCVSWIYGSGFPKSLDIGKAYDEMQKNERIKTGIIKHHSQKGVAIAENRSEIGAGAFGQSKDEEITVGTSEYEGLGTALKPAQELVCLARKPISEKNIVENILKWGTGGLSIDECRVGIDFLNEKDNRINGKSENIYSGKVGNKFFKGIGAITMQLVDKKGRFPANVIHDGSDEVLELFPNTISDGHKRIANSESAFIKHHKNFETPSYSDSGPAARFFYCAKASVSERNAGLEGMEKKLCAMSNGAISAIKNGRDEYGSGHNIIVSKQNYHPTVKPIKLMEYLVKLVTREGQLVLDAFMGSGTTGIACVNTNRRFIGIERDAGYFEIAKKRIEYFYNKMR